MMPIEQDGRLEARAERRMDRHKGAALRHLFRVFGRMAFENVAPCDLVSDLVDDRLPVGRRRANRKRRGTDDEDFFRPEAVLFKVRDRRIGVGSWLRTSA